MTGDPDGIEMSDKDFTFWSTYIRETGDLVGLKDWSLNLKQLWVEDETDKDTVAQCVVTDGRKLAYVWLTTKFPDKDVVLKRWVIVHELTHCHFDQAWKFCAKDLAQFLGRAADEFFWPSFERNMEHGIDAVAGIMAENVPLPKKPKV